MRTLTSTNLETSRKNAYNAVKFTETLGFMCVRYGQAIMWRYIESDGGEFKDYIVPMDYLNNIRAQSFLGIQPYRPSNGAGGEHGQTSKTPEQIQRNIDYMLKRLRNDYPKIKFFAEFGNEPDLDKYFPGNDKYGIMYLDLARHISLALNDETDDFSLVGGVTSGGNNAKPLLKYIYEQDAYKYFDGFSYHPYKKRQRLTRVTIRLPRVTRARRTVSAAGFRLPKSAGMENGLRTSRPAVIMNVRKM
ncbi:MAG: hypothetical protein L6V93_08265 [Clostridiales bacterium]|nr:MAG: hypothetical protein L6V93_08265 [Clostridiales bacterium]